MVPIEGLVSHHLTLDEALRASVPVSYVLGSNGLMVLHRTRAGLLGVRVDAPPVPGLDELPPYIIDWAVPPVPFSLFVSAVRTLKAAHERHASEALVLICYDQDYFVYTPEQTVTSASVNYQLDVPTEQIIMHLHSHPGQLDRFSATDDRDEGNAGFYGVLSNMGASFPAVTLSLAVGGHRVLLTDEDDLARVFRYPPGAEPDPAWVKRVHRQWVEQTRGYVLTPPAWSSVRASVPGSAFDRFDDPPYPYGYDWPGVS